MNKPWAIEGRGVYALGEPLYALGEPLGDDITYAVVTPAGCDAIRGEAFASVIVTRHADLLCIHRVAACNRHERLGVR